MSHGNGEDPATDSTPDAAPQSVPTRPPDRSATADTGESFAWLRPPAHAAPDQEHEGAPGPEVELDAGLAIATDQRPEPYRSTPAAGPSDESSGGPDAAAPVQYPIPPQNYGQPGDEQRSDQPQAHDQGYQRPSYEQSSYEQPSYEQPSYPQQSYQPPDYRPQSYETPKYQSPNYQSPNFQQPNYEAPNYEAPNYQTPNYQTPTYEQPNYAQQSPQWSQSNTDPGHSAATQPPPAQQPVQQPPAQQPAQQQPRHADRGVAPAPLGPLPSHVTPAPVPPPIPRPEDLLVPNRSPVTTEPASWGWRGRLNRGSGGLFKPKAAPQELFARQAIADIQRSFSRPKTVVVIQPKGGAGKTPTAICLSAAFGAHRGGYVVGWDDNETRGTLAVRVSNPDDQRATAWDLLSDLAAFERFDARVGDLSYYVRSQPDAHFDALVSDDNPGNMAQIGEEEYQRLHKVLQRFYRMIVVDTGNNVRSPNWQAAVNSADLVVVVSTYQRDVGYSGSWVLDHLAQTGREELARNAVTVLTAADPTTDKTVRGQLIPHFEARTRAVVEIPYDVELAHGGPIRWSALAEATRNAWIAGGATIVNALVEQDRRELQARRG